jgi:hypothetical protein
MISTSFSGKSWGSDEGRYQKIEILFVSVIRNCIDIAGIYRDACLLRQIPQSI